MNSTGEQQLSAEEQFHSAMSMLRGANPERLDEAVTLIDDAAAAGDPEATERRSLLECKGVGRPADWNKALDTLAAAAQLGSKAAARQLILLAEDRIEPAPQSAAPSATWVDMRSRVRIAERLRPPVSDSRPLSLDPFVRPIPRFATAAECKWLVETGEPSLQRATVYNVEGAHRGRTNQHAIMDLGHTDLVVEMIRARIANELNAPLGCLEISQVLRYRVGEEFVLHCDFLDPRSLQDEIDRNGQRSATFLIYLNEDFEGGETSFPAIGIEHRGKTGDALVWGNVRSDRMPDPRTQHAGCPPTSGEKWVFSQWIRDRFAA